MGLGKTVQVIGLLLHRKSSREASRKRPGEAEPAGRAGLAAGELEGRARAVRPLALVPDRPPLGERRPAKELGRRDDVRDCDLVITTYGMLVTRRNGCGSTTGTSRSSTRPRRSRTRARGNRGAVKELKATARVAMTGTPVENRLSDLWSLFDFLNPGLLGGAKAFAEPGQADGGPVVRISRCRTLVGPYILRRLKTDKRVIADLPDKVEMSGLLQPEPAAGGPLRAGGPRPGREARSGRRHRSGAGSCWPSSCGSSRSATTRPRSLGTGDYRPEHSGKFQRLAALCEELAERQEKALDLHAVPRDHRAARPVPRRRLRAARPGAARRDAGRQAAAAGRELPARGRAAVLRPLAQGRRHRAEPDRGLAGHPLRPLVEPRRGEPGD